MITIEQTLTIPADRRLQFELPASTPVGQAEIKLTVKLKAARHPKTFTESLGDLYGCLKDSETFAGDPIELQRKMRDEWER